MNRKDIREREFQTTIKVKAHYMGDNKQTITATVKVADRFEVEEQIGAYKDIRAEGGSTIGYEFEGKIYQYIADFLPIAAERFMATMTSAAAERMKAQGWIKDHE